MQTTILHVRAQAELVERAQRLRHPLAKTAPYAGSPSVTTATVLRAAIARGLSVLEAELARGSASR